jgi:hypothetical protein
MKKKLMVFLIIVVAGGPFVFWLYTKRGASASAKVYSMVWNESRTCYINSYIPGYSNFGIAGKLVKLFSSEAFFRVYNNKGELLRSSEWLLWQSEFTTDERSQWVNGNAIYPTLSGYEGWNISECALSDNGYK